jgi:RNase P subunit RPR2
VAVLSPEDADVWFDKCLERIKLLLESRKKSLSNFSLDKLEVLTCPKCKKNLVPEVHTNEKGEKVIILKCECGYKRELDAEEL